MNEERGSGRSTKQIQEAPLNAVFIVAGHRDYYYRLAAWLGRRDLNIHTVDIIEHHIDRLRGIENVVMDHHAERTLSRRARENWDTFLAYRAQYRRAT